MHISKLVVALVLAAMLVCSVALAAPEPTPDAGPAVAPPAAEAPKGPPFDQSAALDKLWKASDDAAVATVNGEKITKGDLLKALWEWNGPTTLEDLVTYRLIKQAATTSGVKVTPEDVDKKMLEQVEKMPGIDKNDWRTAIRGYGLTEGRFRNSIELNAMAEKTVEKDIQITDAQFAEYIKASHILIKPDPQEKDKDKADADAKAKSEKAIADIKAGKKLSDLAAEISDDPGSKIQGGDLGWFKKGRMVKEFDDAVFGTADKPGMKAGEMTQAPVKTSFGYHIILVEKIGRDASTEDKGELRSMILAETIPMKLRDWFTDLKSSARIDNVINPPLPQTPRPTMGAPRMPANPKPAAPRTADQPKPGTAKPAAAVPPPAPPK